MQEAKIIGKEKEQKVEVKQEEVSALVQVPTQHTLAVQLPDGSIISTEEMLVDMYNKVCRLERNIIGK